MLYTLYGPGADLDLAFPTISFISFHVGSEVSISGSLTGLMREHPPKGLSLCLLLCVCWRCDASMLQSGLPDFSPSSRDFVNLNGFAVKEALVFALSLLFFLMFSASLKFVRCCLPMSLLFWTAIFSMVDAVLLYCFRMIR